MFLKKCKPQLHRCKGGGLQAWWALYNDSPLFDAGQALSNLPASSGAVERVWSSASFIMAERCRLSSEHLEQELILRWNTPRV